MIKNWIENNCFTVKGTLNNRVSLMTWWTNKNFIEYLRMIEEETSYLQTDNITQRIYHIINDTREVGKCKTCGIDTDFRQFKSGYREYCSVYCVTQSEERNAKISKNNDYEEISKKTKETNLKKYGVGCSLEREDIKQKAYVTKIDRYGDQYYNNMKQNKETCIERYGVSSYYQTQEFIENAKKIKIERYPEGIKTFAGCKSKAELEILEFLNSFGYNFKSNISILDGLEIDCYCDELKLGIEYCGLYWHSEQWKDDNYHFRKYKLAEEKNVRLITIFEDEWIHKKEQVKKFLKSSIGKFEKRIYGRECIFKKVEKTNNFFLENHLQGEPNNIKHLFVLEYDNNIIGMVAFSTHHRINNNSLVLSRLAFKDNIQIIGGASKLIKNSIRKLNQSIITWSDNRWSTGHIYSKSGFVLTKELRPDYSYVLNNNSFKRRSKQLSSKKILGIPNEITEHQWNLDRKFYRIYDCGKKQWTYNKQKGDNNINGN